MSDNELFELCKEVYEKTEWKDTYSRIKSDSLGLHQVRNGGNEVLLGFTEAPLYTSDYLLEKLPTLNESHQYLLMEASPVGYAFGYAEYGELRGAQATADTPLKALLKLTIAMHEAEELKEGLNR